MHDNDVSLPAGSQYLFVYGTLRRAASPMHAKLARHSRYLDNGRLRGRLYEVDWYPGAVESRNPAEQVLGEVYHILDSSLLDELDAYEACAPQFPQPHEYVRKVCRIQTDTHGTLAAWVYLFNRPLQGLRQLVSGDYLQADRDGT